MMKGMTKDEKQNLYWGLMFLMIALMALLMMVAMVVAVVTGLKARGDSRFGDIGRKTVVSMEEEL